MADDSIDTSVWHRVKTRVHASVQIRLVECIGDGKNRDPRELKKVLDVLDPDIFKNQEELSRGDSVPTPPAEGDVPSPWTPLAASFFKPIKYDLCLVTRLEYRVLSIRNRRNVKTS